MKRCPTGLATTLCLLACAGGTGSSTLPTCDVPGVVEDCECAPGLPGLRMCRPEKVWTICGCGSGGSDTTSGIGGFGGYDTSDPPGGADPGSGGAEDAVAPAPDGGAPEDASAAEGGCAGPGDAVLLQSKAAASQILGCGGGAAGCVESLGFSGGCAACLAEMLLCLGASCPAACASPPGPACSACAQESGCAVAFEQCADAPFPYGACAPSCSGKQCGADGCGGSCGTCPAGQPCHPVTFTCVQCTKSVDCSPGEDCVDGTCVGSTQCSSNADCGAGTFCVAGSCVPSDCEPDCFGKHCGNDGCGGSCGTCPPGGACSAAGLCTGGAALPCQSMAGSPEGGCANPSPDECVCQGCFFDGQCTFDDDCVCSECSMDSWCGDASHCNHNGICDPFNEGCVCADCAPHPQC